MVEGPGETVREDRMLELFRLKRAGGSQPRSILRRAPFHRLVAGSLQELLAGVTMNQMTSKVSMQSESK